MRNGLVTRLAALSVSALLLPAPGFATAQEAVPPPPAEVTAGTPPATTQGVSFTLSDLRIEFGGGRFRIPRLDVVGSPQDAATFRAVFEAGAGDGLAQRIAALAAEVVVIPELTYEAETFGQRSSVIYRDLRIETLSQGKAKRATFAGGELSGAAEGRPIRGAFGRSEVIGIDLAGYARLMVETLPADTPLVVVAESFSADSYSLSLPEADLEAKGLSGSDMRIGSVGRPWTQIGAEFAQATRPADVEAAALGQARAMINAFSVGRIAARTLEIVSKDGRPAATFDDVAISDVRRGAFSLSLNAARVGRSPTATLKGLSLVDYDMAGFLAVAEKIGRNKSLAADLNPLAAAPTLRRFALASFLLCEGDEADCGADALASASGLSFERVDAPGVIEHRFAAERFERVGDADLDRPDIGGRVSGRIEWRRESGALALRDVSAKLDGYGEATASLALDNVTPALFAERRQAAIIAAIPIAVRALDLRLVDAGGVDKLAAKAQPPAAPAGKGKKEARKPSTPAGRRAALADQIARDSKALGDAPAAREVIEALAGFVRDPSRPLTLRLEAAPPIGALDAASASDKSRLWGRVTTRATRD